ncbi:MAG: C-GCAxxG-C-C family protein [Thermodesulfobacteriota bacterium]|nr:C-GCAxxG-C-C family protein [Thermodesulfobacteriota bacterium]
MIKILGEDLNFDKTQAVKMATPFGGGVARWGTVCGAVVGGAMGLGFCFGSTKGEEKENREKTYAKVQEMIREFEKDFNTIQCKELIQLNLLDPADRKKFQEMNMRQRCAQFVAKCADSSRKLVKEK